MYPTIETIKNMRNLGFKRVPLAKEIYADFITPIEAVRKFKRAGDHIFLLESAEHNRQGRYTFIGYEPLLEITFDKGEVLIKEKESITRKKDPKKAIREILSEYKTPKIEDMPPFTGGLVGYFSYDYIRHNESKLQSFKYKDDFKNDNFKDLDLMLFDGVVAFDHFKQKIILITGVKTDDIKESYAKAKERLDKTETLLRSSKKSDFEPFKLLSELESDFDETRYSQIVQKAKNYIREGDIFQVVLSNPLRAKASGSLFDVYRVLRSSNPSPYMFYFSSDEIQIAGASPETLVKLQNRKIYTYPLAGSRKRGKDVEEDERLKKELLSDEKELAEHNMLVDLGRNDVGKISKFGSVKVEEYMKVEFYSHVMHIGSIVSGEILDDKDCIDSLDSILPAGTLSGAPKIRACEIIDELEKSRRGLYGGAVGYIDFSGDMDMCIAIRLVYKKGDEVCIRSGAGIVYDSEPKSEFKECINKAQATVNAVNIAHGGLE